jgi:hypothetical protein
MQAIHGIRRSTLLGLTLLAGACGGGDHNPTGPGGAGGLVGTWTLVGINEDGLPESEDYNFGTADFQSGSLRLSQDGQWEMKIFYDHVEQNQSLQLEDYGQYGRDEEDLSFASEAYGDHIEGGLDEGYVYMIYDFDGDGVSETEFTFER